MSEVLLVVITYRNLKVIFVTSDLTYKFQHLAQILGLLQILSIQYSCKGK